MVNLRAFFFFKHRSSATALEAASVCNRAAEPLGKSPAPSPAAATPYTPYRPVGSW